ncbi:DUF4129 domain-containing protein [Neobacillus cucumis]|uniref:Protein-glutamine gamma-glutamyltransferase-like C-terminal domain-containing protein n=1 Tax=Neobacillus cucumis TaxID=1740721 RepID=A0A2N5HVK2_9BACI|nr:DUF4129 domain-containing protein [Neobacillus cucumis]PLS09536.1 hypothetical protein CVD27_01460 [Neobacillus cucumis]
MLNANKARDDIQTILKKEEYQIYYKQSKGLIETWWEKAKEWIATQLEKLFPSVKSASSASSVILITVMVVILLLLTVTAFILIRNTRRNRLLRKQKPLQSLKDRNWTYMRHLEEAEKLEASEDLTGSTRHLFLAMLLFFHEKEWLEARIWKTNWDYFEELRKVSQHKADQFNDLAQFFENVTYGQHYVSPEEFQPFRTKIHNMLGERGMEQHQ